LLKNQKQKVSKGEIEVMREREREREGGREKSIFKKEIVIS